MAKNGPTIVIIAGANGAGKSTAAPTLLKDTLNVFEFVNADVIARGLSAFAPERSAIQAGRLMLARLDELAATRIDFAFETTLASRTFAPWIKRLKQTGYAVDLVFLWLPDAELAVRRVLRRVEAGGHSVPEETIRRRYHAGLRNFFTLYRPLCNKWRIYDNSKTASRKLIAQGQDVHASEIINATIWNTLNEHYGHA